MFLPAVEVRQCPLGEGERAARITQLPLPHHRQAFEHLPGREDARGEFPLPEGQKPISLCTSSVVAGEREGGAPAHAGI